MAAKSKVFVVEPDSDLDRLLAEVDAGPLVLERSGSHYRLERIEGPHIIAPKTADEIWIGYDPVALGKALAESAGSWADVDTEALLEEIYQSRERASDRMRIFEEGAADDLRTGVDPEAFRKAVTATAGSWADIDGDERNVNIKQSRTEGSADKPERASGHGCEAKNDRR